VGTLGFYLDGSFVAGNDRTAPTSGGTITITATGNTSKGLHINTGTLIAYGAISITATGTSEHAFTLEGTGGKVQSAGDITINATSGTWGLTMYNNTLIQSTGGNIDITSNGTSGGLYANATGGIYASSNTSTPTATPTAGGTLSIAASGGTEQGVYLYAGSLVSFGALTVTSSSSSSQAFRTAGTGDFKAVGDITISAVTSDNNTWAAYIDGSRFIQSTANDILITATATAGHGIYINGGGLVAGNDTTTPTAGGAITINSTSGADNIAGAALRMDTTGTKIIAYGDISIYANGAAAGLNVANQQGHGLLLWGSSQVIRSYNGAVSITGYANRTAGGITDWANISGGITLYSGSVIIRAKGNLTLNGVSSSGIGLYLTYAAATGGGITSDEGSIVMNGLSNAASYGGAIIRLPITATLGSVSISAAGQNYAYYQDAWYGSVSAKTDVNIIGYATAGHGIYLGIGSVTSSN
jgi:hypothetical protein